MQQLKTADVGFLVLDGPNTPSIGSTIWIYDRSTADGELGFEQILDHIGRAVPHVPAFSKKLLRVPGGIDRPYWIDDPDLDLEYHVRHLALPPPGDWRQFWTLVARLHARPLDMSRPLWELSVVEGLDALDDLPRGAVALVLKIHHAAVDGQAAMAITRLINSSADLPPVPASPPEPVPSALELIGRGVVNTVLQPVRAGRLIERIAQGVRVSASRPTPPSTALTPAPQTRFGGNVSAHRVLDAVYVDFADLSEIRRAVEGATINDVAIAVFGGALRSYLGALGELPREPLRAMTPVALPAPDGKPDIGNRLSSRVITLATNVADPGERFATIVAASKAAKADDALFGQLELGEALELIPTPLVEPATQLMRPVGAAGMAAAYNTCVSNVSVSRERLFLRGATLIRTAGGAPLSNGIGLMNYLMTYVDEAMLGFTACRTMMPDPQRYADAIRTSFDELLELRSTP